MRISVIIPNFNKARYIEETILSLARNIEDNIEWLVVDDGSTDHSVELLERLAKNHAPLKLFHNPSKGGSSARNFGLKKAKGEFIIFLDSDDLLSPTSFENRIRLFEKFPANDLLVFPMGCFKNEIGDLPQSLNWIPGSNRNQFLRGFLAHDIPWSICQPIWRKSFLEKIGGFDESFKRLQDIELHTKALIEDAQIKTFPEEKPDCFYRISDSRHSTSAFVTQKVAVDSAVKYYNTYLDLVNPNQQKYLACTLLEILSGLVFQYQSRNLSQFEFTQLKNELINCCPYRYQRSILLFYCNIQRNRRLHIMGLKKLCRILLKGIN